MESTSSTTGECGLSEVKADANEDAPARVEPPEGEGGFRLFELPPELMGMVFDHHVEELVALVSTDPEAGRGLSPPSFSTLLVCRVRKHETLGRLRHGIAAEISRTIISVQQGRVSEATRQRMAPGIPPRATTSRDVREFIGFLKSEDLIQWERVRHLGTLLQALNRLQSGVEAPEPYAKMKWMISL